MKYDTPEYARSRLVGTIVKFNQSLVLVEDINNEGFTYCVDVVSGEPCNPHYNELDLTPIKLGYVNKSKSSYYITRVPKRQDWKQGTRRENITVVLNQFSLCGTSGISFKEIANTAIGKFPKISTCFNRIMQGKRDKEAFSRDFCLAVCRDDVGEPSVYIEYSGFSNIGIFNGQEFKLYSRFSYLKERLLEYASVSGDSL